MTQYTFHTDPGHGWLKVPRTELVELGLTGQITYYSYQSPDGKIAYLEEDRDAEAFIKAKGWTPDDLADKVVTNHTSRESFIRRLPHFRAGL